MRYQTKKIILIILSILLVLELAFVGINLAEDEPVSMEIPQTTGTPTEETNVDPTDLPVETPFTDPTQMIPETEEPTAAPAESEPTEQRYILTFTGDCTLGSTADKWSASSSFVQTVGENYSYPFANVLKYFEEDDFTMINLEGVLADSGTAASKRFAFRGPVAYTQIMTGSSVEAVTLANNHTEDYGSAGYKSTTQALTDAGITFVEKNKTAMHTTESGLKIGLYAGSFDFSASDIKNDIAALKNQGAEIIICAFHWGSEGQYRPNTNQQYYAKLAIDAGADIVYGNHPHVLQKVETYKDGIIYYSLGNFSFGGSVFPQDYDSALLQQEVIRDADGTVRLGDLTMIPCSISSMNGQNNFQPTPVEEGKVYDRIISKLDGSFTGPDLVVQYDPVETEPAATEPAATQPETPAETVAPEKPEGGSTGDSGNAGTGDSGNADTGDSGNADTGDSGNADTGDSGSAGSGDSGSADSGDSGSAGSGDSGSAGSGDSGSAGSGDSGSAGSGDSGSAGSGDSGSAGSGGEAAPSGDNGGAAAPAEE